jgi:8-oxo-dGTP pyrophosphatase MutT (NUDIX family)
MGISDYIAGLRRKLGNDLLLLPSVGGVVFDEQRRVLLQQASDDGEWYVPGGAIDPGEEPADAIVREMLEETGLNIEPVRILGVAKSPNITYPNGHQVQYVAITFLCRIVGGTLKISDDESLALRFFDTRDLPLLREEHAARIVQALADEPAAAFRRNGRWHTP